MKTLIGLMFLSVNIYAQSITVIDSNGKKISLDNKPKHERIEIIHNGESIEVKLPSGGLKEEDFIRLDISNPQSLRDNLLRGDLTNQGILDTLKDEEGPKPHSGGGSGGGGG